MNTLNNEQGHRIDDNKDDYDISSLINCKYVDINSFKTQKFNHKDFSLMHLNIGSLEKNKDELEAALSLIDFKFNIIGISATKIKTRSIPKYDLCLDGYKHYWTSTEANKGGTII